MAWQLSRVRRLGLPYNEGTLIRGYQRCHGNTLFTDMAAFRINLGIQKAGLIWSRGIFLLLVANCQFVATSVTWIAPPPAWNQTDPKDIRTVDILVFNRSTQVHLKWNYTLSAGSNLLTTTFSIDESVSNDIGVIYHGSDTTVIYDRTRFNISTNEVATLIINRATEREETTFQCKLSTLTNTWVYKVRVKLTELQIHWDQIPSNLSTVEEGNNITLQWTYSYTLGLSPKFRQASFTDLREDNIGKPIANKLLNDDLFVEPAYRDRVIHIQDTTASMTILAARRSDSGRYKFEVETLNKNKLGRLSSIVKISVQFAANLTNVSRDQTVREESNMQLFCEVTGSPTPNITWTRVLEDGSNSEILHQGPTWDFPNISRTASSTYRCTADNGFGNPVSHKVKVNVIYPAKIVKLASEQEVAAQKSVSLQCIAEGNPQPTYTWTPCDPEQSLCHESTLNISEVLNDFVYTCNVTNVLGSDTRNTSLVVASSVINVTLVITSESCTDEEYSQSLLWSELQATIDEIFKNETSYQNSTLSNVRCGSVIVDLALKFNSTVKESDVLTTLRDAAKDGKLGDFNVNASAIVGTRPQTATTASTRPTSSPEIIATPTPIPDQNDDDKSLKDWEIAVVASVAGVVLIAILVFLIYWFTIRKKTYGADDVDMSPTLSYVVGGPSASRSMDRRSYGMESVEDDPFILAASTQSLNSTDNGKKKKTSNVNYGYLSEDSVQHQPEMLLKPGSRVSSNRPMTQSTAEPVANSSYLVRGPQRDLNTLPPRHEPPSFEEAMLRSKTNGYLTEPGKGRYAGRRPNHPQATNDTSKGPLDPTVLYATPHKKKMSSKPRAELHGPALGHFPQYNQTERSGDSMLQHPVDLDLDDPSNLPAPIESPQRNGSMSNIYQDEPHYDLPEPPANFTSAVGRDSRSDSDGAVLNPPPSTGRKKQPYFNVHGQLVRPALQDSRDVQRPESSRTTQNTLSPDPDIPLNEVQPRGSESEDGGEQDIDYVTYVV